MEVRFKLSAGDLAQLYDTVHALRTVSESAPVLTMQPPALGSVALSRAVASAHGLLEKLWFQVESGGLSAGDSEDRG